MNKFLCLLLIFVITGIISEPGACPEIETTSVKKSLKVSLPRLSFRLEHVRRESEIEVEVMVTAYTSKPGDETYLGTKPCPGTIAVDPMFIPLESIITFPGVTFVSLPGQKYFTAVDTGTKVKGWKVDVWMPSKKEADDFGIQKMRIKIKKPLAG